MIRVIKYVDILIAKIQFAFLIACYILRIAGLIACAAKIILAVSILRRLFHPDNAAYPHLPRQILGLAAAFEFMVMAADSDLPRYDLQRVLALYAGIKPHEIGEHRHLEPAVRSVICLVCARKIVSSLYSGIFRSVWIYPSVESAVVYRGPYRQVRRTALLPIAFIILCNGLVFCQKSDFAY